ncbi:hydrogenase maturation nickel metallochaperone HypA [Chloroflexota bacterium]
MHEFSITQSMLDLVSEKAKGAGSKRVRNINLVIGEMTGYVPDCVQFYFGFLSKGTLAEGAALSFKMIPAKARCRACNESFEVEEFAWTCPNCHSSKIEIIAGRELQVESIEVE